MCEKRDTLILPCRHLCLCKACAINLRGQSNSCPICRVPFNALLQMEIVNSNKISTKPKATAIDLSDVNINEKIRNIKKNKDFSNLNIQFINDNNNNDLIFSRESKQCSPIESQTNLNNDESKIETFFIQKVICLFLILDISQMNNSDKEINLSLDINDHSKNISKKILCNKPKEEQDSR